MFSLRGLPSLAQPDSVEVSGALVLTLGEKWRQNAGKGEGLQTVAARGDLLLTGGMDPWNGKGQPHKMTFGDL